MHQLSLFLGLKTDDSFENLLALTNPYLATLLIGKEEYLQNMELRGERYLGKFLQVHPTLEHLEDMEKHILSLLQKLAPQYPFAQNPLQLLTVNGK
jgi:hypothetical protein